MKPKFILYMLLTLFTAQTVSSQSKPVVYLIPGQGADHRLFNELQIDEAYEVRHIKYSTPEAEATMQSFAKKLAEQIDTNEKFILIGVSLGGMLATEMSQFLHPEKVIIISSAKSRKELPVRYRFQRALPFYKLVSPNMAQKGALFMQPIVEPDRDKHEEIFVSMLEDKDPLFLRRTIEMIIKWDRKTKPADITHIHGNNDHTIPIRNVNYNYIVEDGSHMMTLTRGAEISQLINGLLKDYEL